MRIASIIGVVLCTLTSCSQTPERAAYITYLGRDTLAVERFVHQDNRFEASVMLRTPETSLQHYVLEFDDDGMMRRFEAEVRDPASPEAPPRSKDLLLASPAGFTLQRTRDGEESTEEIDAEASMLPFLDMIHWPYELALRRAYDAPGELYAQPLLTGTRTQAFEIRRLSADSMSIKHPFRGTMGVTVDTEGRLLVLDAGETTRKVRVVRQADIDVETIAQYFAERDAGGTSFGPLSGRGETLATIGGANLRIDFGTPSKRGRDIFGNIVPWSEVWRTGANQATHFEIDKDLSFGDLSVPAGTYTLFTIPEPAGGTLIINTQTGQGGTSHNPDLDLGRVPMQFETLDEPVEVFTIDIVEREQGGILQIMWDRTAFTIPFTVNN